MSILTDWLGAQRSTLTWLDTDRYVRSVFAGGTEHWYDSPTQLAVATAQAHKVLRSDVIRVDLLGPFAPALPGAAGAGEDAAEVCERVCAALAPGEPRALLAETLEALAHQIGDSADLVLGCASPARLLPPGTDDLDALDDVAAALLEVVREVAGHPVRGLVLTCDTPGGPGEDEADSWSSLLAAARHYGWATAVRLDAVTGPEAAADVPADLLLLPRVPASLLPDDGRHGGGLPPEAWADTPEGDALAAQGAARRFRYGEIPGDAAPETVLRRRAAL